MGEVVQISCKSLIVSPHDGRFKVEMHPAITDKERAATLLFSDRGAARDHAHWLTFAFPKVYRNVIDRTEALT